MPADSELTISFAAAGNSLAFLGGGWAHPELDFTWAIGRESHLLLPRPAPADEYLLTLDVIPFVHPPGLISQRLIVSVNGAVVGSADLLRPTLLAYRIPGNADADRQSGDRQSGDRQSGDRHGADRHGADRLLVTLQHPDATRPIDVSVTVDDRCLAFALTQARLYRLAGPGPRAHPTGLMLGASDASGSASRGGADLRDWAIASTGLDLDELALRFESLGENCEFGLFQRRCDAEPLGLLRFSSTFMRNLIRGIDDGFDGLGEIADIDPRLAGDAPREYMIYEKRFGLVYHTFVHEGQRSIWLMREQEAARLKFLRRKFMEELEAAEKIFVYKLAGGAADEEILPLHTALRRHGEATLLWVVPAERNRPAGTVEVVMPGLMKGYIDRFAPEANAHDLSFDGWLRICANALVLARLLRPESPRSG